MLVGVRISKNGCPLGVRQVKCESRLRELDQILRAHDNPLEFMCQVCWDLGHSFGWRRSVIVRQKDLVTIFKKFMVQCGVYTVLRISKIEFVILYKICLWKMESSKRWLHLKTET